MDPLGSPYDDVDALFFEKEHMYDPFENDNDFIVQPKKRARVVKEAYEENIGDKDEDDNEDEEVDKHEDDDDDTDKHEDAVASNNN